MKQERMMFVFLWIMAFILCFEVFKYFKNAMLTKAMLSTERLTKVIPTVAHEAYVTELLDIAPFARLPMCYAIIQGNAVKVYVKPIGRDNYDYLETVSFQAFPIYYQTISPVDVF